MDMPEREAEIIREFHVGSSVSSDETLSLTESFMWSCTSCSSSRKLCTISINMPTGLFSYCMNPFAQTYWILLQPCIHSAPSCLLFIVEQPAETVPLFWSYCFFIVQICLSTKPLQPCWYPVGYSGVYFGCCSGKRNLVDYFSLCCYWGSLSVK